MKKFVLFVLFLAAIPFPVFAALSRFPSTSEEIVQHGLEHVDEVNVHVVVWQDGEYDPFGGTRLHFSRYQLEDGTYESISSVAKRSREELGKLVERMLRALVDAAVNRSDTNLAGQNFKLGYSLEKDVSRINPLGWPYITLLFKLPVTHRLTLGSDGKVAIPQAAFAVNFMAELQAYLEYGSPAFFVSGILRAELTVEDEQGNIIEQRTSGKIPGEKGFDYYNPSVSRDYGPQYDDDRLNIAGVFFTDPARRHGKLKLWYRGGIEQTFNRFDGRLLETIMPDLRSMRVDRYDSKSILLSISDVGDKELVIDAASDLPRWEELAAPAIRSITRVGNGDTAIILPMEGAHRFFQARVVPSSIRIR